MSSGVLFTKTLSTDGHAMMSINRLPTRNRSSTIGGTASNSVKSRSDGSYSTTDLVNGVVKVGKSSKQALVDRVRSNSNGNETGSLYGQSSRRATLGDHFKGRRNSILSTASDVLGLKLGGPKFPLQQSPKPLILPDVIDISAARADAELEERNRLRDMAAQAIGLQPYTDSQESSYDCSITTDEEDYRNTPSHSTDLHKATQQSEISYPPDVSGPSPRASGSSVSVSYPPPTPTSRVRSGSIVATTTSFAPIPPYPSTLSSLSSFRQCEGLYPKYYPYSSLRIFALSKNWKYRYLMMSSPATFVARGQSPAVSYLHVFKSAGPEEKEVERLEINEDSVVFVAEGGVGGKRSVIKVGGTDVGALKKEYMINEGGYSMWLLHIQNTADAQRWITNIKNAILGQRTVRAGLIPAYPLGVHEPHGDMDVMLRIRTQGIMSSTSVVTRPVSAATNENSSLSSRSVHSLKTGAKPPGASTASLSAWKGFFIARPKSTSRPASIDVERDHDKESFLTLGSMLRSNTPDSLAPVPAQNIAAVPPNITYSVPAEPILDRKILTAPHSSPWQRSAASTGETFAHKADIILPLQPPPRKRWTASGLPTLNTNLNDHAFSYLGRPETSQIGTPHFGSPDHRPRASSLQSVSTSGDRPVSMSSSSTKRSSTRRWSKQSLLTLPSMMSPPSDPPPPVPVHQEAHTSPTFSKRISVESSRSNNSSSIYSIRRISIPPPRPAPTSALPPAPIGLEEHELSHDVLNSLEKVSTPSKSTLRGSPAQRSFRLSLMAPKPPPNTSLPLRPDDPDYITSRRRSSSESRHPTTLQTIPGSPQSSAANHDPHLPPVGSLPPLPPPPSLPLPVPPLDQLPSTKRVSSLKQRLRMLSSGSVSGVVPSTGRSRLSTERSSIDFSSPPIQPTFSPPPTPIAEKIIPFQDDSFLQLYTPSMPTPPFIPGEASLRFQQESETTAVTSLSPPPRRGPKQPLESEPKIPLSPPPQEQLDTVDQKNHLLASPPLSPSSHDCRLLPEASETSTSPDGWMLSEDSSGTGTKLTSFLDSDPEDVSSRPSSIISLGFRSI